MPSKEDILKRAYVSSRKFAPEVPMPQPIKKPAIPRAIPSGPQSIPKAAIKVPSGPQSIPFRKSTGQEVRERKLPENFKPIAGVDQNLQRELIKRGEGHKIQDLLPKKKSGKFYGYVPKKSWDKMSIFEKADAAIQEAKKMTTGAGVKGLASTAIMYEEALGGFMKFNKFLRDDILPSWLTIGDRAISKTKAGKKINKWYDETANDLVKHSKAIRSDAGDLLSISNKEKQNIFDNPELLKDPEYIIYSVSSQLPHIVAAFATGGLSEGLVEGSLAYLDVEDKKASPKKKALYTSLVGIINGILGRLGAESVLGKGLAKKELNNAILKYTAKALEGAVGEGGTEYLQEAVPMILSKIILDIGKDWPDVLKKAHQEGKIAASQAIIAGLGGAAISGGQNTQQTQIVRPEALEEKKKQIIEQATQEIQKEPEVTKPEIAEPDIPQELQDEAQQDWIDNYADRFGELERESSELGRKIKEAKKAEREKLQAEKDKIDKESAKIEQDWIDKYRAKVKKQEFSGNEISDEVKKIGSDQGVSDFTLDQIKKENYKTETISINELRKLDKDLDEYIRSGEIRKFEGKPFAMDPVVSSKGEVIDGYNRVAQALKNGDTEITILRGIEKKAKAKKPKIITEKKENKTINYLKKQIGDIFEVVEPVGDLWKSKGNTLFIKLKEHRAGFINKLRQSNFIENAQEAGGDNVIKVTVKSLEKPVEKPAIPKAEIGLTLEVIPRRTEKERLKYGDLRNVAGETVKLPDKTKAGKLLFDRIKVKTLLQNSPEFSKNPVLEVIEDFDIEKTGGGYGRETLGKAKTKTKYLSFKGDTSSFKIKPSALGLVEKGLNVGDKIKVNVETFKTAKGDEIRVTKEKEGKKEFLASPIFNKKTSRNDTVLHLPDKGVYAVLSGKLKPGQIKLLENETEYIPFSKNDIVHLSQRSRVEGKHKMVSLGEIMQLSRNARAAIKNVRSAKPGKVKTKHKITTVKSTAEFLADTGSGAGSINEIVSRKIQESNTEAKPFIISKRAKEILEHFGVPARERTLNINKYLGLYKFESKSTRFRSLYQVKVVAHEATHAIGDKNGIEKMILSDHKKEARYIKKRLTDIYVDYYPEASETHPARKRIAEGLAVLVENYFYDPQTIQDKYSDLVQEIIKPGGRFYHEDISTLLEMLNDLVDDYAKLTPEDRIGARIRRGEEIVKKERGFNIVQRLIYEGFNRFEPLVRWAKRSGKSETFQDPMIHAFNWFNKNTVVFNWLRGEGITMYKPDGNYEIIKDEKGVPITVEKYMKLVKGQDKVLDEYLVARRVVYDYKKLNSLKLLIEREQSWLKENGFTMGDLAISDPRGHAQLLAMINQAREIDKRIKKDDFTYQDSSAVLEKYKDSNISEAVKIYDIINKSLLEFAYNSGLLKQEQYESMRDEEGYASFQRYIDDDIASQSFGTIGSAKSRVKSFKKRGGSELDIISPIYSQVRSIQEVITKSLENNIWRAVRGLAKDNPEVARRFEKIEAQPAITDDGKISFPQERDPNLIRVWVNGSRQFYKAGPEFLAVAKQFTPQQIEAWVYMLTLPGAVFTRLTTSANPFFAIGNLSIDQISALAQTKTNLKPLVDPFKTIGAKIKGDPLFKKFEVIGGLRQTLASFHQLSPENMAGKFVYTTKLEKSFNIIDKGIGVLEFPSNMSEVMTRFAEFKRAKDKGKSDVEAMYMAQQVTVPFQQYGHWFGKPMQIFIKGIPYFNAALQVMYKFLRASRDNPTRVASVGSGIMVIGTVATIAVMQGSSDEQKRLLAQMPIRLLTRGLYIPLPDGKSFLRIRIPEQFGSFMAMAQLYVISNYSNHKAKFDDYLEAATALLPSQFDPTHPKEAFMSWIPQTFKPTLEAMFNVKTFPKLSTIEPEYYKTKPIKERVRDDTTKLAITIGLLFDVSPIKVDFWIKEQFGGLAGILQKTSVKEGRKRFITNKLGLATEYYFGSGRAFNSFYNLKLETEKKYQLIKSERDSYSIDEQLEIKRERKYLNRLNNIIKAFRDYESLKKKPIPNEAREAVYQALLAIEKGDIDKSQEIIIDNLNIIIKIAGEIK